MLAVCRRLCIFFTSGILPFSYNKSPHRPLPVQGGVSQKLRDTDIPKVDQSTTIQSQMSKQRFHFKL